MPEKCKYKICGVPQASPSLAWFSCTSTHICNYLKPIVWEWSTFKDEFLSANVSLDSAFDDQDKVVDRFTLFDDDLKNKIWKFENLKILLFNS